MTDTTTATPNKHAAALLYGGLIAIVVGAITAFIAKRQADSAAFVGELVDSMGGYGDRSGGPAVGVMWFGIGLAVLGAVMVVAYLAVRAARPGP